MTPERLSTLARYAEGLLDRRDSSPPWHVIDPECWLPPDELAELVLLARAGLDAGTPAER